MKQRDGKQLDYPAGICPICGRPNHCARLNPQLSDGDCWCHDPSLVFTPELLAMVPETARGKACICRECVLKFRSCSSAE